MPDKQKRAARISIIKKLWRPRLFLVLSLFPLCGAAGFFVITAGLHYSSSPGFCMSCHEMRVVGEQGWMKSVHYQNPSGVVAGCSDCHVPPELGRMIFVKTRDGLWDLAVHWFGESDPDRMDWDKLSQRARSKVADSSCRRCHQNLEYSGLDLKALMAHRENMRLETPRRCVECHLDEFHGNFKKNLAAGAAGQEGGRR